MKILIDPVYTARADQCSTSFLVWEIIEDMIAEREDVFFYLMYPESSQNNELEMDFLNRHTDRVTLIPYPYVKTDRVSEMFKLDNNMTRYLSPGESPVWDYDVVLSSRIPQLPFMKYVSNRTTNFRGGTHRLFLGLDEMPMFSFRDTVPWHEHMDMTSITAYKESGGVVINNLWTKSLVTKVARNLLAPSQVIALSKQMHEALPVKLKRIDTEQVTHPTDTLNVVFAGRMTGTRNFKEVAEVFRNHYSYPIGKAMDMNFIVTTNSQSQGASNAGETDFMDIQKNTRKQFHELLQSTANVVVNLSTVEDFSMSTYEPLTFGIPVIVPNKPWTSFLGEDYPFRTHSTVEAYAMVKEFSEDYAGQMEKFKKWEETTWKELVEGPRNIPTSKMTRDLIYDHEKRLHEDLKGREAGAMYREIIQELIDKGEETITPLEYAQEKGQLTTTAKSWTGIPITLRPSQYLMKVYANIMGFEDTNKAGVLRKKK